MLYGEFSRTDLALEFAKDVGVSGRDYFEERVCGCDILRLDIDSEKASETYGKPKGKYVTVSCGKIWEMDDERCDEVSDVIADEILNMVEKMSKKRVDGKFGVLIAGLGNDEITPDAIGPEAVRRIEVTRHIRTLLPEIYDKLGSCELSALSPGVLGQTGIETVELVRGAAENVKPDVIIAIDALAARSVDRLASTIQLSDNGINPGSGIGNMRRSICCETVGAPVLALGVPTVVDSSTLVYDALSRAGVESISDELVKILEDGRGFFVAPKESDVIMKKVAVLLARAIGRAFSF